MPIKRRHPVPDWCWKIKVGDILLVGRRRTPRVVRAFSLGKSAGKTCICFTITRCSWTKRCYTTYNLNDLLYMGLERPPVRMVSKMNGPMDARINKEIGQRHAQPRGLSCCDVHGVA